jgi:hypothetical protein
MNELITIEKAQAMDIFTRRELIAPLLEKIKHAATQQEADITTDKGRKEIASMAYRVAQSKTYIESHGKELAAELKELPKLVDKNRKYARDFLDSLKDEVRKPLDAWEAEQAAIKLKAEIEEAHGEALIVHAEWLNAQEQKRIKEEQERKEYEERIRREAEDRATREAEEKAQRAIIEAKAAQLAAEQEAKRMQENSQREIEMAEQRARQEAQKEAEQLKAKEEEKRLIKERRKREASNIDKVHRSIINDLMAIGLNSEQANYILDAVQENKIKALRIEY